MQQQLTAGRVPGAAGAVCAGHAAARSSCPGCSIVLHLLASAAAQDRAVVQASPHPAPPKSPCCCLPLLLPHIPPPLPPRPLHCGRHGRGQGLAGSAGACGAGEQPGLWPGQRGGAGAGRQRAARAMRVMRGRGDAPGAAQRCSVVRCAAAGDAFASSDESSGGVWQVQSHSSRQQAGLAWQAAGEAGCRRQLRVAVAPLGGLQLPRALQPCGTTPSLCVCDKPQSICIACVTWCSGSSSGSLVI